MVDYTDKQKICTLAHNQLSGKTINWYMKVLKYYLLVLLIFSSCNFPQPNAEDVSLSIENANQEVVEAIVFERSARYKYGDSMLLKSLYSSIENLPFDGIKHTLGVYEMAIDTNGVVVETITKRSISTNIDSKILSVCDTLSFYPATLNGKKISNRVTVPIRIEVE